MLLMPYNCLAVNVAELKFARLTAADGLCDNQMAHILQLPDGRMVFTTAGNMNIYDGTRFTHIHRNESDVYSLPHYHGAYHVYVDKYDRVWIKDYQRVVCYDLRRRTYVEDVAKMLKENTDGKSVPVDLFVDSHRRLWVLAGRLWNGETGKAIVMQKKWGELQDIDCDDTMAYLFFNTGNVVAISLKDMSVKFCSAAYDKGDRQKYSSTSLVVKGSDGVFYQLRNGPEAVFLAFNPKTKEWRQLLKTDYVLHTLIVDGDEAYIICQKGLWTIDLKSGRGVLTERLHLTDGKTTGAAANTVFLDKQGGMWIGTYTNGLLYAHPRRYPFKVVDELPIEWNGKGRQMTDSRGWTWTATNDGLQVKRGKDVERIYSENGLANDFVHSVVEDADGKVWIATSNGISCATIDKAGRIKLESFRSADGIQNGDFLSGMTCRMADGRIAMKGHNGITVFHPHEALMPDSMLLNPILVNMTVNGKDYDWSNGISLSHDKNTLTFTFAAMNFVFPQHTHYKYRLISDGDTLTAIVGNGSGSSLVDEKGALRLSFINASPGKYKLEVWASLSSDTWNGGLYSIDYTILPPWWATWWAYTLYILLALAVIVAGVSLYLYIKRKEAQQKMREQRLMARIESLIEQSRVMEESVESNDKSSTEQDANNEFLRKAIDLVEQHIGEPYSVEQLSRDLCMERTGLYKRLSAMLDKSPSLFMRSIRLRHAARLIAEGGMTMTEIAERTGFSSASYFGKCFYEEYHCRPSEYTENKPIST